MDAGMRDESWIGIASAYHLHNGTDYVYTYTAINGNGANHVRLP